VRDQTCEPFPSRNKGQKPLQFPGVDQQRRSENFLGDESQIADDAIAE